MFVISIRQAFWAAACFLATEGLACATASAQDTLTPAQAHQLQAFLNASGQLPIASLSTVPSAAMAEVLKGSSSTQAEAKAKAPTVMARHSLARSASAMTAPAFVASATSSEAPSGTVSEMPETAPFAANGHGNGSLLSILSLGAPSAVPSGITLGIATGEGVIPQLPVMASLDHQSAQAVITAFQQPAKTTAEQAATLAADLASANPALEERVGLARAVFQIDGTDAIIRHFVATEHMRLIITEVANHIDFSKLSESDKYRLSAIAAAAQAELEDKIINLNAVIQANNLTKPELLQLLAAYDSEAQRKLTHLRLNDDGKIDRSSELDIHLAQYQIVKAYETAQ